MFWKITIGWLLVGAVVEFMSGILIAAYYAGKMMRNGTINEGNYESALEKYNNYFAEMQGSWSIGVYKIFPGIIADVICLTWSTIVLPLELILAMVHGKESANMVQADVNKAS